VTGHSRLATLARGAFAWAVAWVFAAALYLLLIDITDLPELIVGGIAAALAATGAELARHQDLVGESVRLRWLVLLYRPLLKVPADVAVVSLAALRGLIRPRRARGRFRAVKFVSQEDERHARGRRAVAVTLGSFAPNTIIVGVDPERELLLAHQLQPRGGRDALDLLRLGGGW